MKGNERVWRTLIDRVSEGKWRWPHLAELGDESAVPLTTAHLATRKLVLIGAIDTLRGGGLVVRDPDKILTLLCAARNPWKEMIASTTERAIREVIKPAGINWAWGGLDAAEKLLGYQVPQQDGDQRMIYVDPDAIGEISGARGGDLVVMSLDGVAAQQWAGYSSIAQTIADLFTLPGPRAKMLRWELTDVIRQAPTSPPYRLTELADSLVKRASRSEAERMRLVFEFLRGAEEDTHPTGALIFDEPALTGDSRFDALLAGLAEYLALQSGMAVPAWTDKPERFLRRPWWISELPSAKEWARKHSPLPLRRRGVYLEEEELKAS